MDSRKRFFTAYVSGRKIRCHEYQIYPNRHPQRPCRRGFWRLPAVAPRQLIPARLRQLLLLLFLIASGGVSSAFASDAQAEALSVVKQFAGHLQPALQKSLREGGPKMAIEVCSEMAPAVAADLSERSGWQVRRVSLKPRNHTGAVPDAFERETLVSFEQLLASGTSPDALVRFVETDGEQRLMKAQVTGGLCLVCHGKSIDPEVARLLDQHYPSDTARGYGPGEVRGAFSLRRPLPVRDK